VYQQLALLIALPMAGMAAGSAWGLHRKLDKRAMAFLQVAVTVAPLFVFCALTLITRLPHAPTAGQLMFLLLALLAGMLGGLQFAAASRVFFREPGRGGAGVLYALDLAGACLGAIAVAGYLAPVFGFLPAAEVMAVVAAGPAWLALLSARYLKLA
jgi:hypothetical protein